MLRAGPNANHAHVISVGQNIKSPKQDASIYAIRTLPRHFYKFGSPREIGVEKELSWEYRGGVSILRDTNLHPVTRSGVM
jgi:hypothetical protein